MLNHPYKILSTIPSNTHLPIVSTNFSFIFFNVDAHKDYTYFFSFFFFIQGIKILLGISGCYVLLKYVKGHHIIYFHIVQRIIIIIKAPFHNCLDSARAKHDYTYYSCVISLTYILCFRQHYIRNGDIAI